MAKYTFSAAFDGSDPATASSAMPLRMCGPQTQAAAQVQHKVNALAQLANAVAQRILNAPGSSSAATAQRVDPATGQILR